MEIYRANKRGGYNRSQSARNNSNCNQLNCNQPNYNQSNYNQSNCNQSGCNQSNCNQNYSKQHSTNQTSCNNKKDNHSAHHDSDCSAQYYNAPLAMTFINMQNWCETYPPEKAMREGTIFPNLNMIFCGSRGKVK